MRNSSGALRRTLHLCHRGQQPMITDRIRTFLSKQRPTSPCLIVDRELVQRNYLALAKAFPNSKIFYAVKANPEKAVLRLLAKLGSCFDVASIGEVNLVLALGVSPKRISFGNPVKKETDIRKAFELGIRPFAVDALEEVS